MTPIVLRLVPPPGRVLLPDGLERLPGILEPMQDQLLFRVFTFDGVSTTTARASRDELGAIVSRSDRVLELDWMDSSASPKIH